MKKIAGILLLFCLIVPYYGTHAWLKFSKFSLKKEIRKELSEGSGRDALVRLGFTKAQVAGLRWEGNDEFEVGGRMYDVTDQQTFGDSVVYLCRADHEEDRLNRKIRQLITDDRTKDPKNREQQDRLREFFNALYCNESFAWHLRLRGNDRVNAPFRVSIYDTPIHRPPVPPPETA